MNANADLERILYDLIAFDTVSKSANIQMISYLEDYFSTLGFTCTRLYDPNDKKKANLLCHIGPMDKPSLMLSGHTDVVPVADQQWHSNPFLLTKKNDLYIGRGVTDMKGFIASACVALSQVNQKELKKPISLLWTYDEEVGCKGSKMAAPLLKEYLDVLPCAALIGEPTEFCIVRMHSGHVTLKVDVRGKGAHSSKPDLGSSAIKIMNQILKNIFLLEDELRNEKSMEEYFKTPFVTLNVGLLNGGTAVNIIPDNATAQIGFRPLPNSCVDSLIYRIKNAAVKNINDRDAINIVVKRISPTLMTKEGTFLEKVIMPHAQSSITKAAAFSTDGGNISREGIDCLVFGPGSINVAHQANEWIRQSDLNVAIGKLKKIIESFCLTTP